MNDTDATARIWREYCADRGLWISPDNRVGLKTAATLVGLEHRSLLGLIGRGEGPDIFDIGGGRHKKSVRLLDLASWLEARKK